MSKLKKALIVWGYLLAALTMLHLSPFEALAADSSGDWRSLYDLAMRCLNFLILAFLLIKYSRLPLKNFLRGKKEDIAREIEELEADKALMLQKIDENRQQIQNSKERLAQLKKTIIAQGEKNKIKIIADAQRESKILLESAKQKMESRIADARNVLRAELVDEAIALAMKKLPQKITDRDNQQYIDAFVDRVAST